ncbi:hypothetical protein [Rhizobium sp. R339]|uniref:hypothetical protein n=1 Tax=Rhizobium sp. R339 TaxID=1764273 RepID=UPI0011321EAB|nr:hypothetical protein [Rhizobium sp. R339]
MDSARSNDCDQSPDQSPISGSFQAHMSYKSESSGPKFDGSNLRIVAFDTWETAFSSKIRERAAAILSVPDMEDSVQPLRE